VPGGFRLGSANAAPSKKVRQTKKEAAASVAAAPCLTLKSFIYRDLRGPRAAASAGRAHFVANDSYGLLWVIGAKSGRSSGFVASSFFAFFNGFLVFLVIFILLHLICPAGHRRPYMQRHRQSPYAFLLPANRQFHWLFVESANPAHHRQRCFPLNSSFLVENFNATCQPAHRSYFRHR
jgi:hypothetical protein